METDPTKQQHSFSDVDFSLLLSQSLDNLGFSYQMICLRRNRNHEMDELHNKHGYSFTNITAGGKGEGTALYFESDIDRLCVVTGVTCVEPGQKSESSVVFETDTNGCSAGYTRLKLVPFSEIDNSHTSIKKSLSTETDNVFIKNDFSVFEEKRFTDMRDINGDKITWVAKHGPADRFKNESISYDFVTGFTCWNNVLIHKWVQRPRHFSWPSLDLIDSISKLEAHVVPVANKGSAFPTTEWRICYTKAELLLMQSLNESQIKLYVLLKLLAKSVLKPICREMSSYIMKNVIFWMLEKNPAERFSQQLLLHRLLDCLMYLKECIIVKLLKSYMIAERNLLQDRISDHEREELLGVLTTLIVERQHISHRIDKVSNVAQEVINSSSELAEKSKKRDNIETLILQKNLIYKQTDTSEVTGGQLQELLRTNDEYVSIEKKIYDQIVPDIADFEKQNVVAIYKKRLFDLLS